MGTWRPIDPVLLLGLAAALGACVTVNTYYELPACDFLARGESPPPVFGAYGYLVFTARPAVQSQTRYGVVCAAFLRNLGPVERYSRADPSRLMPTYWLVDRNTPPWRDPRECPRLLERYDYARAKLMATRLGKRTSPGPILVAWKAPYPHGTELGEELVLDLSTVGDDDLGRAFGIWMDRIGRDPRVWDNNFNRGRITDAFRDFIQEYGGDIVRVATKTP